MTNNDFYSLSLNEKRETITEILKEIKDWSEELKNLYFYFSSLVMIEEKECDEVYKALTESI